MTDFDDVKLRAVQQALDKATPKISPPKAEDFITELRKLGWSVVSFRELNSLEAQIPRGEEMGR